MNIKTDSVINYVIPNNIFSCEYGTDSLKYTASLSNGLDLPSWLHFDTRTRTLSGTPKQAKIDTIKITATNTDTVSASSTFRITFINLTDIEEDNNHLPNKINLFQNYPNPFNPSTTIHYSLAKSSFVKLNIYNLLGQNVRTLQNAFRTAGEYSVVWDAMDENNTSVSSGMYFYRIQTEQSVLQKKMILIK